MFLINNQWSYNLCELYSVCQTHFINKALVASSKHLPLENCIHETYITDKALGLYYCTCFFEESTVSAQKNSLQTIPKLQMLFFRASYAVAENTKSKSVLLLIPALKNHLTNTIFRAIYMTKTKLKKTTFSFYKQIMRWIRVHPLLLQRLAQQDLNLV